jgi:Domain of unknown function (DUF1844)
MSDREKPFTVSDRRHFTPEGEPRSEPARPSVTPTESQEEHSPRQPEPPVGTGGEKADFSAFVLSLAGQAVALLAGEGLPEEASPADRLEGARSIIAILEMLKEKTEGRRTAAEDEVLEGLLFELRMGYVAKARVTGA